MLDTYSLGRSQSQTECYLCSFLRAWVAVFHSLPLMPPAFLILIKVKNRKSLLSIPLFFSRFPYMSRSWYLTFFDSWNLSVLSSQGTVNSKLITYFGYTDHRNISGRRFERVTSLRKLCVRSPGLPPSASSWIRSTGWYLLRCLFLYLLLSQNCQRWPYSARRKCTRRS